MKNNPITIDEINSINFFTQTDEQLEELSLRIANESQTNREKIYSAIVDEVFYGDIRSFNARKISKMTKEEVEEQTRRKKVNDNIKKVINNKDIRDDYDRWAEEYLEKHPEL